MLGGYAGRFLWVDLATGKLEVEVPDEQLLRDFVGGYGVAARVLYDRMPAGVDPRPSEPRAEGPSEGRDRHRLMIFPAGGAPPSSVSPSPAGPASTPAPIGPKPPRADDESRRVILVLLGMAMVAAALMIALAAHRLTKLNEPVMMVPAEPASEAAPDPAGDAPASSRE